MPYHAARAIAATFCYEQRWALTPIFGNDFPSLCVHPKHPNYAKFQIDPAIVHYCAVETKRFATEGSAYRVEAPASLPSKGPGIQFCQQSFSVRITKERKVLPADLESGYGTDTDRSDPYLWSPDVSPRSQTVPTNNRSLSPLSPPVADSPAVSTVLDGRSHHALLAATSAPIGSLQEPFLTKRTHSKVATSKGWDDDEFIRPRTATTMSSESGLNEDGRDTDYGLERVDIDAAELLMALRTNNSTLPPMKRTRRGSEY